MGKRTEKSQSHGGKRKAAGRPPTFHNDKMRGIRMKKSHLSAKKKKTSISKCKNMRLNYRNSECDKNYYEKQRLQKEKDEIQKRFDNIYNALGSYLNRDEIEKLYKSVNIYQDYQRLKEIEFDLMLHEYKLDLIIFLFHSAKRQYTKYKQRHFIHSKDIEDENEEEKQLEDDENIDNKKYEDYFNKYKEYDMFYYHVSGVIHHIFSEFNYIDLYFLCRIITIISLVYLYYLRDICDFDEYLSQISRVNASAHNDIVDALHGLVSYIMKMAMTLSDENLENYTYFVKNKIVQILDYLRCQYPTIYSLLLKIYNSHHFKLKHLEKKASIKKNKLKINKINYMFNKITTKTDQIRMENEKKKQEKEQNKNKNKNKGNLNVMDKVIRKKKTKISQHLDVEEKKKKKRRKKEIKILKKTSQKNKKKNQKKKKKMRIKDVIDNSGIYKLIEDIKEIGYHRRMNGDVIMMTDDNTNNEGNDDQDLLQEIQEIDGNESVSDQHDDVDDDDDDDDDDCELI